LKKLIVVGLAAVALTLTACGGPATGFDQNHYNNTYCDGNLYSVVDEDDYTCSKDGEVYYEGDHEDDSHKKHAKGAPGPVVGFSKPKASTKPNSGYKQPSNSYKAPAYKAPAYKAPSSSSKSYSFKK
jgi:hypothetical protein